MGYYGGPMVKAAPTRHLLKYGHRRLAGRRATDDSVLLDRMVCDLAAGAPETYLPPEPITHVNDVRLDLTMVWDVDGTAWLLPAHYRLHRRWHVQSRGRRVRAAADPGAGRADAALLTERLLPT
jgi:hypothetical protein